MRAMFEINYGKIEIVHAADGFQGSTSRPRRNCSRSTFDQSTPSLPPIRLAAAALIRCFLLFTVCLFLLFTSLVVLVLIANDSDLLSGVTYTIAWMPVRFLNCFVFIFELKLNCLAHEPMEFTKVCLTTASNRRETKHQKLRVPWLPMMEIDAEASDVLAAHVAPCVHQLK